MNSVEIKIAYIGGGSRYWARDLITELALTPRLKGRIDLYDLNYAAAVRNIAVADRIYGRPEAVTRFQVRAVRRLADALPGWYVGAHGEIACWGSSKAPEAGPPPAGTPQTPAELAKLVDEVFGRGSDRG